MSWSTKTWAVNIILSAFVFTQVVPGAGLSEGLGVRTVYAQDAVFNIVKALNSSDFIAAVSNPENTIVPWTLSTVRAIVDPSTGEVITYVDGKGKTRYAFMTESGLRGRVRGNVPDSILNNSRYARVDMDYYTESGDRNIETRLSTDEGSIRGTRNLSSGAIKNIKNAIRSMLELPPISAGALPAPKPTIGQITKNISQFLEEGRLSKTIQNGLAEVRSGKLARLPNVHLLFNHTAGMVEQGFLHRNEIAKFYVDGNINGALKPDYSLIQVMLDEKGTITEVRPASNSNWRWIDNFGQEADSIFTDVTNNAREVRGGSSTPRKLGVLEGVTYSDAVNSLRARLDDMRSLSEGDPRLPRLQADFKAAVAEYQTKFPDILEKLKQGAGVREKVAGGIPTPTSPSADALRDNVFSALDNGHDPFFIQKQIIEPSMKGDPQAQQKAEKLSNKFYEAWKDKVVEDAATKIKNGESEASVDKFVKEKTGLRSVARQAFMEKVRAKAAEFMKVDGGGPFEATLKKYIDGAKGISQQKVVSALQTEQPQLSLSKAWDMVEGRVTEFLAEEGLKFAKGKSLALSQLTEAVYQHLEPIAKRIEGGSIDSAALREFAKAIASDALSGSFAAGGFTPREAAVRLAHKFKSQRGSLFGKKTFFEKVAQQKAKKLSWWERWFGKGSPSTPTRTSWYEALNTSVKKSAALKPISVQAGIGALFMVGTEFSLQLAINYEQYGFTGGSARALQALVSREGLTHLFVGTVIATPVGVGTEILRGAIVQQLGKGAATALVSVPATLLLPIGFWLQGVEAVAVIDLDTKEKEQALAAQNMVSFLGFGGEEPQGDGQKARNANLLYLAEEFAAAQGIATIPFSSESFLQSFGEELVRTTQEMEEKRVWVWIYPTTRYVSKLPVGAFVYDQAGVPHLPEVLKGQSSLAINLASRVFTKAKERWERGAFEQGRPPMSEKGILRKNIVSLQLQETEQFAADNPDLALLAGKALRCSVRAPGIDEALATALGPQGDWSVLGFLFPPDARSGTFEAFKNLLDEKGLRLYGDTPFSLEDCLAPRSDSEAEQQQDKQPASPETSLVCTPSQQQVTDKLIQKVIDLIQAGLQDASSEEASARLDQEMNESNALMFAVCIATSPLRDAFMEATQRWADEMNQRVQQ